ncbi:MAG: AraC family transcriptional regulator [Bacteroidia bacterium]|nr:AraC family transcriptional regulator [Bacteroidia bacterium]
MQVISIPETLLPSTSRGPGSTILFHSYESEIEHSKVKVEMGSHLISFILEGQKQVFQHASSAVVDPHSFLMLRGGNCLMTERLSENRSYKSFLFFFDKEVITDFMVKHKIKAKVPVENPDYLVLQKDPFIKHFLESLLLLIHEMGVIPQALKKAKFEELMLYLIDRHGEGVVQFYLEKNTSSQEINFKKVIEQNLDNKLSLEELAFLCNMSISTFKRKFAEHYESSPSKWFLQKRMEQAEYMLRVQKLKPSEIYFELGFSNLSSFSQAFKNRYGSSPAKYSSQVD